MDIIVGIGCEDSFTSAVQSKNWTAFLKEKAIFVVHVVSSVKFAHKAEEAWGGYCHRS